MKLLLESSDTLDWLSEYEQTKALKDEAYKLKVSHKRVNN